MSNASAASAGRSPSRSAPWQFSLANLMEVMLAVAVFSGLWRIAPQLAVLVLVTSSSAVATWRLARSIRRRRIGRRLAAAALLSWCAGYVVSIGPAVALTQHTIVFDGVVDTFYAPLEWLYHETPLDRPLDWYVDYWRRPGWQVASGSQSPRFIEKKRCHGSALRQ